MKTMYSIYLKDKCILTGLTEHKFKQSWETLHNLVGLVTTQYTAEDLSYEVDHEFSQFPYECPRENTDDLMVYSTAFDPKKYPGFDPEDLSEGRG